MAIMSITVPDTSVQRVLDAFTRETRSDALPDLSTNALKLAFVQDKTRQLLIDFVKRSEVRKAADDAAVAAPLAAT